MDFHSKFNKMEKDLCSPIQTIYLNTTFINFVLSSMDWNLDFLLWLVRLKAMLIFLLLLSIKKCVRWFLYRFVVGYDRKVGVGAQFLKLGQSGKHGCGCLAPLGGLGIVPIASMNVGGSESHMKIIEIITKSHRCPAERRVQNQR